MNQSEREAGTLQGLVLLFPITLTVMALAALVPVLPQMYQEFGASPGAKWLIPLIITTPALCLVLFSPVAGLLGDLFGRRRFLIVACFAYAAAGLAPVVLNDLWAILASRVLVGVSEAIVAVLSTTLISDYFKGHKRDRWFGYQTAVASMSAVFLFALAGLLGNAGWRAAFFIYATPLVMGLMVWMFTWEQPPRAHAEAPQPDQADETSGSFPWTRTGLICLLTVLGAILFYVVQIQASVAFHDLGIETAFNRGLLSAFGAVGTVMGTVVFRFTSLQPRSLLLGAAFLLIAAGFWGLGLATRVPLAAAGLFVAQFGCGILLPTLLTWVVEGMAYAVRGRGMGVWQASFALGQFGSTLIVTMLVGLLGSLTAVFLALALVGATSAAVALGAFIAARRRADLSGPAAVEP